MLAANKEARLRGAHATVGRVGVEPNATNAIPSRVTGWLDARAADAGDPGRRWSTRSRQARAERAGRDGTAVTVTAESVTPLVAFDGGLAERLAALLGAPVLPTGAGHDAGVLAAHLPTAMLFVRNPTGVSHSPGRVAPPTPTARPGSPRWPTCWRSWHAADPPAAAEHALAARARRARRRTC